MNKCNRTWIAFAKKKRCRHVDAINPLENFIVYSKLLKVIHRMVLRSFAVYMEIAMKSVSLLMTSCNYTYKV